MGATLQCHLPQLTESKNPLLDLALRAGRSSRREDEIPSPFGRNAEHRSPRHDTHEGSVSPVSGKLKSQVGSVTIWGIGLTLVIAAFAGLVLDTWRVFAERQDLAGMADSAAIAGATAIDLTHLNESGEVVLDEDLARERAELYLLNQDGWSVEISPDVFVSSDLATITVVLEKDVDFTLLGPLIPGEEPLRITVTSLASPNVVGP